MLKRSASTLHDQDMRIIYIELHRVKQVLHLTLDLLAHCISLSDIYSFRLTRIWRSNKKVKSLTIILLLFFHYNYFE